MDRAAEKTKNTTLVNLLQLPASRTVSYEIGQPYVES
jgi:hypothetical protein